MDMDSSAQAMSTAARIYVAGHRGLVGSALVRRAYDFRDRRGDSRVRLFAAARAFYQAREGFVDLALKARNLFL